MQHEAIAYYQSLLDETNAQIAELEANAGDEKFLSGFGDNALRVLKKAKKVLEAILTALPLLLLASEEGNDDGPAQA